MICQSDAPRFCCHSDAHRKRLCCVSNGALKVHLRFYWMVLSHGRTSSRCSGCRWVSAFGRYSKRYLRSWNGFRALYSKYHPEKTIRLSMNDYRQDEWVENIPLFATHAFFWVFHVKHRPLFSHKHFVTILSARCGAGSSLAQTKIPAHEQYAGIFAVYYILGELCASYWGANESL